MTKEHINKVVQNHYNVLVERGYEVFGIFLYGSQNYEMDYEYSDIDTKAIIIPSFEDIVKNKQPISTVIEVDGGQCDIKDIRVMFDNYLKQNVNFLETLFTKYKYVNEKYQNEYEVLYKNREKIASYDMYKFLNATYGMALQKYKALNHPYPSIIDRIEKFGFDRKQAHHCVRLCYFMDSILENKGFEKSLVPINKEYVLNLKKEGFIKSAEDADCLCKYSISKMDTMREKYVESTERFINPLIPVILEGIVYKCFKIRFKEEILSE